MNQTHFLFALCIAAPLSFAAGAQEAATTTAPELRPVTVHEKAACPGIDESLQTSLSPAWGRLQRPATMRVQFRLDDGRVTDVQTTGAGDYRAFVRRAVRRLDCGTAATGPQDFAFTLDIVSPDQAPSQEQVAVLRVGR